MFNYTKYGVSGFDTLEIYGLVLQRPHNDLLWVIAELGVVGFAILAVFWFRIMHVVRLAKKSKLRTIIIASIVSFLPILLFSFPKERVEHIFLFFIIFSVARSLGSSKEKAIQANWVKFPIIIVSLFSIFIVVIVAKGEYFSNRALQAMKNNQPQAVIENINNAESIFYSITNEGVPLASYSAWAYNQLQDKEKVFYYSEIAYCQTPFNYEIVVNYGMALNSQRDFDNAEKFLLKAYYLNPRYDGTMLNLAVVYYNMGKFEKAKEWIDRTYYNTDLIKYYRHLIEQKLKKNSLF